MLSRMGSRASIVYIYTLVLQGSSSIKHARCIERRLSLRMIEESFCHWNLRIIACSNCRRPNIKMSFDKLLFPVCSNRKSAFVLLRRWLLEVILVQCLIVSSWILRYIYITFMSNFKVISFKMFNKFSIWLDVCCILWMNKLLLLCSGLLKFVICSSNAEVRGKSFILSLNSSLTLSFSLFIKEGFLSWAKKGPL